MTDAPSKLELQLRHEARLPKWCQHRLIELRRRIKVLSGEPVTYNYGDTTPSLTDEYQDPCYHLMVDLPFWARIRLIFLREKIKRLENNNEK